MHGSAPRGTAGARPSALAEVDQLGEHSLAIGDPARPEPPPRQPIKLGQDGGGHRLKPAVARSGTNDAPAATLKLAAAVGMAADTPPPSVGPGTPTNRAGPRWGRIR